MTAREITYRYRRPGKGEETYRQLVVLERPDTKVLLTEAYGGAPLEAGGAVIQEPGAPIVWYLFPEKWHDIGRFHLADGSCTGFYTNLTTPVEMNDDRWSAIDMFLDLWQPLDGEPMWLDEDELADAAKRRVIDTATKKRVLNERAIIELELRRGAWPPPVVRDIDLGQAKALLAH